MSLLKKNFWENLKFFLNKVDLHQLTVKSKQKIENVNSIQRISEGLSKTYFQLLFESLEIIFKNLLKH